MENKKEQSADQKEIKKSELFIVEKIKEELNISDAVFAGVMAHKGWARGKQITKKEMETAISEFLKAPLK